MNSILTVGIVYFGFFAQASFGESISHQKVKTTTTTTRSKGYRNLLPPPSVDPAKIESNHAIESPSIEDSRRVKSDLIDQSKGAASKPKDAPSKGKMVVGVTCTDSNGRSFSSTDEGYNLCIQSTSNSGQARKNPELDGRIKAEPNRSNFGPGVQIKLGK